MSISPALHSTGESFSRSLPAKVAPAISPNILSRVARADSSAIDECVNLYGGLVWSAARKYTDSPTAAEIATREIFQDIWQYAEFFDEKNSSEQSFILLIASQHLEKCGENVV